MAIKTGEEKPLKMKNHTIISMAQRPGTRPRSYKISCSKTDSLSKASINRAEEGLKEVRGLLKDSMKDRTMIIRFLSLGPTGSSSASLRAGHRLLVRRPQRRPPLQSCLRAVPQDGMQDDCFLFLHPQGR